jgi:hypothetical protein
MLQWRTGFRKLKLHFVINIDQAVHAASKSVSIGLITVPQSWLHDALASLYLLDQSMHIRNHVFMNVTNKLSNNSAEQYSTKPWCRINGQHDVPQRESTSWCDRPRMPKLDFGKYFDCYFAQLLTFGELNTPAIDRIKT